MMTTETPAALQSEWIERLAGRFPEFEVTDGFSPRQFYGSLRRPLLSVTLPGIKLIPAGCGDYFGMQAGSAAGSELYGRFAEVTVGFSFFLPAGDGWKNPNPYFLELCALLMESGEDVAEITCSEPEFLDGMQCFVLRARALMRTILAQEEQWAPVREIVVRMKREEETT